MNRNYMKLFLYAVLVFSIKISAAPSASPLRKAKTPLDNLTYMLKKHRYDEAKLWHDSLKKFRKISRKLEQLLRRLEKQEIMIEALERYELAIQSHNKKTSGTLNLETYTTQYLDDLVSFTDDNSSSSSESDSEEEGENKLFIETPPSYRDPKKIISPEKFYSCTTPTESTTDNSEEEEDYDY